MPTRRQFLRVGLASGALLVAVRWLDAGSAQAAEGLRTLDAAGAATVRALVPVILQGALPAESPARDAAIGDVVAAFDRAVSGMSPPVQEEVAQLFSFLAFAPARVTFAGLWAPVAKSSPEELAAFLARWRMSTLDLQRAGYQALTQLVQAAWYGNAASWPAIGYPGPPPLPA